MTQQPIPEPVAQVRKTGFATYDIAERWVSEVLARPEFGAAVAPNVTVSMVRAHTGQWSVYLYGWPPARLPHTDIPARPAIVDDNRTMTAPELKRFTERWQQAANPPRMVDLGDLASAMNPGTISSSSGTVGVPAEPPPVHPRRPGLSAYEDDRALNLDLDTEVPKGYIHPGPMDSAIRGAMDAEAAAARRAVLDPTRLDLHTRDIGPPAATTVPPEAMGSFFVPASGHRPDETGTEPVSYPKCTSQIKGRGGKYTCRQSHAPGERDPLHSNGMMAWRDNDRRIVKAPR